MKTLSFVCSILLLIFSCSNKPAGFEIKGNLINAHSKTIYLDELTITNIKPVDSVVINKNGYFSFQGITSEPTFFLLRISRNNFITLLIDSLDNVSITGDFENLSQTYDIEGSKDSKLIKELLLKQNNSIAGIDSLNNIYRENMNNSDIDLIKAELEKSFINIISEHHQFLTSFIEDNTSSFSCLMALYQSLDSRNFILTQENDMKYFNMVDSALSALYPNSKHVKTLHANIIENKRKINYEKTGQTGVNIGDIAPEISLPSPDGDTISLSSLRGKYVLIDFWAAWCKPCRWENPNLVANYKKYNNKGFEIFQVSLDRTKDTWVKAIKKDNLTWYHVSDLKYWNSAPAQVYNIYGIPANLLIDKKGKIIAKNLKGAALGKKLSEIFD